MSETEKKIAVTISIFYKFTALIPSTRLIFKQLSQLLIYSDVFYFALSFHATLFIKDSLCAAALVACSLQDLFPFPANSSSQKIIFLTFF